MIDSIYADKYRDYVNQLVALTEDVHRQLLNFELYEDVIDLDDEIIDILNVYQERLTKLRMNIEILRFLSGGDKCE